MKIHDLEVFCAVAEEESFVKAARRLYVSQSAVTQLIRKIETELGFPLLIRNKHFVKITAQGKIFYSAAKDIQKRYWQALEDCSREPGAKQTLRVFYVGPSGAPYLTGALKRFHSLYPDCSIVTRRLRPDQVCGVLESKETNLVFTPYELIADRAQLFFYPLYQDCHYCVTEAGNPLTQKKQVLMAELAGKHILLSPRAFQSVHIPEHIQVLVKTLTQEEMHCKLEEASNIDNALIQLLSHNDVIAIVPGFCIPEHPRLRAAPLEDKVQIQMGLAYRQAMTRAEEAFALLAYEAANSYPVV
jgi:DNA-binding transcriptional LysR family regulator